jgi:hypothetical protein
VLAIALANKLARHRAKALDHPVSLYVCSIFAATVFS